MVQSPAQHKKYGIIGLGLIFVSFSYWLLPSTNSHLMLFNTLFYVGNILFFDYLSYHFSGFSLLQKTNKSRHQHFLILGFLFGFFLEFYAHFIGKFWYYPHWSETFYLIILVPGFACYAFYLIETYLGTKAVLEYFLPRKKIKEHWKHWKIVATILGFVGILGSLITTLYLFSRFSINEPLTFTTFLSVNFAPQLNVPLMIPLILMAIFVWLILEWIEYLRRETSMLHELFHGNMAPIIAVFIAAWGSAILYEVLNVPGGLWRYANFPFPDLVFLGAPITAILLWPLHYFPLFSLYRVLFKSETKKLWE